MNTDINPTSTTLSGYLVDSSGVRREIRDLKSREAISELDLSLDSLQLQVDAVEPYDDSEISSRISLIEEKEPSWDSKSDFSGSYNDLLDKPTIPSKVSELQNDSGYLTEHQSLSDYAKKSDISSVYKYIGSVNEYTSLPTDDLNIGDVYNVASDGQNYAWTGYAWDSLGSVVDLSNYYTKLESDSKYLTEHTPVDSTLSDLSENPVQNKVVATELNNVKDSYFHVLEQSSDGTTVKFYADDEKTILLGTLTIPSGSGASADEIATAVAAYMTEHPVSAGVQSVTLEGTTLSVVDADGLGTDYEIPATGITVSYLTQVLKLYLESATAEATYQKKLTDADKQAIADLHKDPDLSVYAKTSDIPTALSDMTDDATHRLVTDAEKEVWNNTVSGDGNVTEAMRSTFVAFVKSIADRLAFADTDGSTILSNLYTAWGGSGDTVTYTLDSIAINMLDTEATEGTATSSLIASVKANLTGSDGSSKTTTATGYRLTPATISEGSNSVTVSYTYNGTTKTATVTVTGTEASEETIAVTGIALSADSGSVEVGSEVTITATVTPSNATDKTVVWSSSDTSVATVSSGKITALKAGTTTITASCGGFSDMYSLTVTETEEETGTEVVLIEPTCSAGGNYSTKQTSYIIHDIGDVYSSVLSGHTITKMDVYAKDAGIISFGKTELIITSSASNFNVLDTVELIAGLNTIVFDNPITLSDNETIIFGKSTDTGGIGLYTEAKNTAISNSYKLRESDPQGWCAYIRVYGY